MLAQNRAAANSHDDGGDASWVAKLAAEIAQLNNQGPSAKIYVSPDVLAQRKVSRKMMVESIIAARAQGDKPRYALRNKVFLNERLIDPFWIGADRQQHRTEIDWTGAPNESMIPINASAKEIFGHFKASIGSKTPVTDDRPISVTAAGLTVHAAPPKRRTNAAAEDGNLPPSSPTISASLIAKAAGRMATCTFSARCILPMQDGASALGAAT